MVFNSYTPFTIWVAHHAPGTKTVADLVKPRPQGPARARNLEPQIELIEEILLSRDLAKVPIEASPVLPVAAAQQVSDGNHRPAFSL